MQPNTKKPCATSYVNKDSQHQEATTMGRLVDKVRRIPAEKFKLPSNGFQYPEDMFDGVDFGEIEVFPISSYDEILLKTPEMLLSGEGIYEVIVRKIPCIKYPKLLAHKDVDFILSCLRKVTYGDQLTVEYTHDCESAKKHSYNLLLSDFIGLTKHLDPTLCSVNFKFNMPNDQEIILNNIKFTDVIKLTQLSMKLENEEFINAKDIETSSVQSLAAMIKSVDGVLDQEEIQEWLMEIPAPYIKVIQNHIQKMGSNWGIEFTSKTKCKDCGAEIDLTPSINPIGFFMRL